MKQSNIITRSIINLDNEPRCYRLSIISLLNFLLILWLYLLIFYVLVLLIAISSCHKISKLLFKRITITLKMKERGRNYASTSCDVIALSRIQLLCFYSPSFSVPAHSVSVRAHKTRLKVNESNCSLMCIMAIYISNYFFTYPNVFPNLYDKILILWYISTEITNVQDWISCQQCIGFMSYTCIFAHSMD